MLDRSTLDSGNIDQEFYDVLLIMYSQAISKAIELPRNNGKNSERERLRYIMISSSVIGRGYYVRQLFSAVETAINPGVQ